VNIENVRDKSRIASDTLFQVRGPAMVNYLSPNDVCMRGNYCSMYTAAWQFAPCCRPMMEYMLQEFRLGFTSLTNTNFSCASNFREFCE